MNDQSKNIITTETAAKLLMVTPEWVRRLTKDGAIKKLGKDRYDVVAVVQGYITFLKDEQRKATKSAAASRVQDARAAQIELQTAREVGKMVEIADVIEWQSEILGTLRSELTGVPAAATRDLPVRAEIEKHLNGAIDRCRAAFEEAWRALRGGKPFSLGPEDPDA